MPGSPVPDRPPVHWTVVIPVKGTGSAKSRLEAPFELAMAIALDTVQAALGAARVIVVTSTEVAADFAALGAEVVVDTGSGLAGAVRSGIEAAGPGAVAVMLGDLPALRPEELGAALEAAAGHPLALVPDADGVGSVLITRMPGAVHAPAFGGASRSAHLRAGYAELDVATDSGLRRDVDTADQLAALAAASRLGRRTAALAGRPAREAVQAHMPGWPSLLSANTSE
jgi:2-phospho-L-lactate guanylyltransferase